MSSYSSFPSVHTVAAHVSECNKTKHSAPNFNAKLNPITNHTGSCNPCHNCPSANHKNRKNVHPPSNPTNTPTQAPNTSIQTPESSTSSTISGTSSESFSRAKATALLPAQAAAETKNNSPTAPPPLPPNRNTHSTKVHLHSAHPVPPRWRFRSFTNAPKTTPATVVPCRSGGLLRFRHRICKPVATTAPVTNSQRHRVAIRHDTHDRVAPVGVLRPGLGRTLGPCLGAALQVREGVTLLLSICP